MGAVAAKEADRSRERVWQVWSELTKAFGIGRLMRHLLCSKSGWGLYEVDVISTLKATPMGEMVAPLLMAQTDDDLHRLLGMARLNARRNDAIWKMAALFYVSGPTTLILTGFQVAPKLTRYVLTSGSVGFMLVFLGLTFSLGWYYTINWRAAQVEALVELEMVERGLEIRV